VSILYDRTPQKDRHRQGPQFPQHGCVCVCVCVFVCVCVCVCVCGCVGVCCCVRVVIGECVLHLSVCVCFFLHSLHSQRKPCRCCNIWWKHVGACVCVCVCASVCVCVSEIVRAHVCT